MNAHDGNGRSGGRIRSGRIAGGRGRRCRMGTLSGRLLPSLLLMLATKASVIASETNQAYFAEPASGRKVTQYEIELPVQRDEHQRFTIPDECGEVMQRITGGETYLGGIIDRGLWRKTENDCRYHDFLNRHPQPVLADYVSGLDFGNIDIADLPLDQRCIGNGAPDRPSPCDPAATDGFGMLRHFPISSPAAEVPRRADCIPCRLRNGRFRGYVAVSESGIQCRMDANAPGVRLIAVDFADINGDRILDAVLRFIPIGPASRRTPLVLPLTRLDASAPLSVPGPATIREGDQH